MTRDQLMAATVSHIDKPRTESGGLEFRYAEQAHRMVVDRKPDAGFTLIELLVTIAVFAILVAMAVPSFVDAVDRRRIIDASEGIAKQIQQARTIAIQASRPITMVFDRSNAEWCFGLTDQLTCDCNAPNDCQSPSALT
jgi:prepilin-type N-terminal cleavage/methylation domain-containing protein